MLTRRSILAQGGALGLGCLGSAIPSSAAQSAGRRVAVLIGVQRYRNGNLNTLEFPEAEVREIERKLIGRFDKVYRFSTEHASTSSRYPSLDNFEQFWRELGDGKLDVLMCYVTGHGKALDGSLFLTLPNTREGDYRRTALRLESFLELAKGRARFVACFVDTCRSYGKQASAPRGKVVKDGAAFSSDSALESLGVVYSTQEGQAANEKATNGVKNRYSAFGQAMLNYLDQHPPGTEVRLAQLADHLATTVPQIARAWGLDQVPELEVKGRRADFPLIPGLTSPRQISARRVTARATLTVTSNAAGAVVLMGLTELGRVGDPIDFDLLGNETRTVRLTVRSFSGQAATYDVELKSGSQSVRLDVEPLGRPAGTRRTNAIDGAEMVWVPPGSFQMGSPDGVGDGDEHPMHRVRLTQGFWIYRNPVTHAQYEKFLGVSPNLSAPLFWSDPRFKGDSQPVVGISWDDAQQYCRWAGGRLPTEAEREYAARGPQGNVYPWGSAAPTRVLAVFDGDGPDPDRPAEVGGRPENTSWCSALDLAGNVWEWCADWYGAYEAGDAVDPAGPRTGHSRVVRGGSWFSYDFNLRATYRRYLNPTGTNDDVSFRLVLSGDGRGEDLP